MWSRTLLSQACVSSGLVAPYGFVPRFFLTLALFLPALLVAPADEEFSISLSALRPGAVVRSRSKLAPSG